MSTPPVDPARELADYLSAGDEPAASDHLGRLLTEVAGPVVEKVLRRQLGGRGAGLAPEEFEDLRSGVLLRLQLYLMAVREGEREAPESLPDYAATAAYNAASSYQMSLHPERTRLRDRVRYVLRREDALSSWSGADRDLLCGLARFEGEVPRADAAERLGDRVLVEIARTGAGWGRMPRLVDRILGGLGGPCRLEDLVSALAAGLGVEDRPGSLPDEPAPGASAPSMAPSALHSLDARQRLERAWEEIRQLPAGQRFALLVNLRGESGEAMLEDLLASGVAAAGDLAAALEIEEAELVGLLPSLPRDDLWIADRLGLTRQQVINLRKSARLRLARRLRDLREPMG